MNIIDYIGMTKYIRIECEDAKKKVEFVVDDAFTDPYVRGDTIYLHQPDPRWSDESHILWQYQAQNLISQFTKENINPSQHDVMEEKQISENSVLGHAFNIVAQHAQEHNRIGVYEGRDQQMREGRHIYTRDYLNGPNGLGMPAETQEGSLIRAIAAYDTMCREDWNAYMYGMGNAGRALLSPEEQQYFDKLVASKIRIQDVTSMDEAYEVAKKLLEEMDQDSDELEQQAQQQKQEEEQQQQQGQGKPCDDGDEGESEGGQKPGEKEKKEMEAMSINSYTKYNKESEVNGQPPSNGLTIDYSNVRDGTSMVPQEGEEHDVRGCSSDNYTSSIMSIHAGEMLANNVRMLFASMKQVQWEHRRKRGTISGKNLWKATYPVYDQDVYKHRIQKLDINTDVTVLCDFSGSMSGEKFCHAAKAAMMVNDAVTPVGVNVELLGFSERGGKAVHVIIKGFNERVNDSSVIAERYSYATRWMGSNNDGDSILWAHSRLLPRKAHRKVLIVLSDGQPASARGNYGDEVGYAKDVIHAIETKSPVEIYGVGIMTMSVSGLYKNYKIINNASELEEALLGIVKSSVLR